MQAIGSVVLDTNIAIAFMAGDRLIRQRIADADQVILSIVVVGELFFGAHRSGRLEHNLKRAEELAANSEVVDVTMETARNYGVIKTALRRKGTPIPDNDIWIAAVAQQYGAAIATRDSHFDSVENLAVVRWYIALNFAARSRIDHLSGFSRCPADHDQADAACEQQHRGRLWD